MARVLVKKPGILKNVEDCTADELYYSSEWNNWKIAKDSSVNGTVSLSVPADNGDWENPNYGYVDITHGLGYVPAVEFWVKDGANIMAVPGPDITVNYNFDIYIDSTKVMVTGRDSNANGAKTFTVYYKIYHERIDA